MTNIDLSDRVAIVTGATRGIGLAVAGAFVAAGCRVVLSGRSPEKGKQAVDLLGPSADYRSGDAREQGDVEGLVDWALERHGRVDILVNNAGGSSGFALVADLSDDAWREAEDWILNSTFWATRRVLPGMASNGWGRIINISSVESKFMQKPMASHYATFKAAVNAFGRAVAVEYGAMGVTCNSICPGAVETDLMREAGAANAEAAGISYAEFLEAYAQETLVKKINTVEQVAAVALLLASDLGGGMTGTAINVDGGTSPY